MTLSISYNEFFFCFTRAVAGLRCPFGIGEENARILSILQKFDISPLPLALRILSNMADKKTCLHIDKTEDASGNITFSARHHLPLSSLMANIAILQYIGAEAQSQNLSRHIDVKNVENPLHFIASCLLMLEENGDDILNDKEIHITWGENVAIIPSSTLFFLKQDITDRDINFIGGLSICFKDKMDKGNDFIARRAHICPNIPAKMQEWQALKDFFFLYLVPSSPDSKLMGAGAGLVDTD